MPTSHSLNFSVELHMHLSIYPFFDYYDITVPFHEKFKLIFVVWIFARFLLRRTNASGRMNLKSTKKSWKCRRLNWISFDSFYFFAGQIASKTTIIKPPDMMKKLTTWIIFQGGGLDVKHHPNIPLSTTEVNQIYIDLNSKVLKRYTKS